MRFPIRATVGVMVAWGALLVTANVAGAEPDYDPVSHYDQPQRLPVIAVVADDWQPKFPFPYDETKRYVTPADVTAEGEMCQWYDVQFDPLKHQVQGLNNNVVRHNGDFNAEGVSQQADIVTANLDQSLEFLTPRAQALTQTSDRAGDIYFPIYQGDAFYGLWQQMSNLANGLKARQPTWFTGPSFQLMLFWGSKIHRSHVCS